MSVLGFGLGLLEFGKNLFMRELLEGERGDRVGVNKWMR